VLAAVLAGCGGSASSSPGTTVTTTPAAGPSVVAGPRRRVSFAAIRHAVDELYREHPAIRSYTVRDVSYNPTTRDKVLDVCRRGGAETDAASKSAVRVAGCAPLIFFFYNYGRQESVPAAVDLARMVFWYAATSIHGPLDVKRSLTVLLRSWGVP